MATVPVVSFSNSISTPADPSVVRDSFSKIVFNDLLFYTYAWNESDFQDSYSDFNPQNLQIGEMAFFFWNLFDSTYQSGAYTKPDMVSEDLWGTVLPAEPANYALGPSGFFTSNSVMPRLIIPSTLLKDNGSGDIDKWKATVYQGGEKDLFNWRVVSCTKYPSLDKYFSKVIRSNVVAGSQSVSLVAKDDTSVSNETLIELSEPVIPPTGDWEPEELVGQGASCFMFSVTPNKSNMVDGSLVKDSEWYIEVVMSLTLRFRIQSGDLLSVYIGQEGQEQITKVPLQEVKGKEVPSQFAGFENAGGNPYVICIYPVWNGVVVSQGLYSVVNGVVQMNGTYCPKIKEASVLSSPYSTTFDPKNPDVVEVNCGTAGGSNDVLVDFGSHVDITTHNCTADLAYLPLFFWHRCAFDQWFLANQDSPGTVTYEHTIYPIWTKNRTDTIFYSPSGGDTPEAVSYGKVVAGTDTEYLMARHAMLMDNPNRFGPQYFGYIHRIRENLDYTVDNGNGGFTLNWSGGTPGDPDATGVWTDYVQSINVTLGLDGSSGSITVDKYGLAGQDASVTQSIGALCIKMESGGYGDHISTTFPSDDPGYLFKGLALGISNMDSPDGDTWTIPLYGLEKKLEDIVLISVPFFDGYQLDEVAEFLLRYGGINGDVTYAPNFADVQLRASEDVNNPAIDFKTGTPVLDAINEIMQWGLHTYVIRDGKMYFYEIDPDTSLPKYYKSKDWSAEYPTTRVETFDLSPDFEDLRNEIVIFSMQMVPAQFGTDLKVPSIPKIVREANTTTPTIPWSKTVVAALPGLNSDAELAQALARRKAVSSAYALSGRVSIPGNQEIRPLDKWGSYFITSVSHNIDFQSKTWKTDLELAEGT